jgi:hypothetical protein
MNIDIGFKLEKSELAKSISPTENQVNIALFSHDALNQQKFSHQLKMRMIETEGEINSELLEKVEKINEEINSLLKKYEGDIKSSRDKGKLDFDIAKIFHSNLNFSRSAILNYRFWRWLTLSYFIEKVVWRWISDPNDMNKIRKNAITVFQRGFGERDRRIDTLRYWVIAERLWDRNKQYYYLDKIAESAKKNEGPFQDFINNLIDNNLYSPNENVTKVMGSIMLTGEKLFKTKELIFSFKRYHSYTNRFLIEGNEDIFRKEICLISR